MQLDHVGVQQPLYQSKNYNKIPDRFLREKFFEFILAIVKLKYFTILLEIPLS